MLKRSACLSSSVWKTSNSTTWLFQNKKTNVSFHLRDIWKNLRAENDLRIDKYMQPAPKTLKKVHEEFSETRFNKERWSLWRSWEQFMETCKKQQRLHFSLIYLRWENVLCTWTNELSLKKTCKGWQKCGALIRRYWGRIHNWTLRTNKQLSSAAVSLIKDLAVAEKSQRALLSLCFCGLKAGIKARGVSVSISIDEITLALRS